MADTYSTVITSWAAAAAPLILTTVIAMAPAAAHAGSPALAAPASGAATPKQWQVLFDGKITDAFRGWNGESMPEGWHVVDGALTKDGNVDELVSRKRYANFDLRLDWKIGKDGNSGIFYRTTREYDHIYWSGPEYQLLDDANAPDGKSQLTAAGSDYGLYPALAGVVKPYGQWNHSRLLVRGNHVEHWLNGKKVVAYELNSADWQAKVAASKFSKYPNYGLAPSGYIGIQGDHPGSIALRAIKIRELP
jgi:Domain of Unknown Function (DUF1080)